MKSKIAGATNGSLSALRKFAPRYLVFKNLGNLLDSEPAAIDQGWVSDGHFFDIDAQAAQYHGYEQQYQQISRGPFEGRLQSFSFGAELVINLEMGNREIAASAATPRGRYGACFLADASPSCALNASEFSQDHVVLSPPRATVEGRMSEGVRIFCMDLAESLLPDDGRNMQATGVLRNPVATRRLRELVTSGLQAFSSLKSPENYPAAAVGFKSSLADLLWQIAALEPGESVGVQRYSSARSLRVFRRAREYIDHHLQDGISIVTLCKDAGVSRRSLESIFCAVLGIGPAGYIRALQLNRVRRDLLVSGECDVSIGEIAARHGIWHWSRFSSYYRQMFGELPSETRRCFGG